MNHSFGATKWQRLLIVLLGIPNVGGVLIAQNTAVPDQQQIQSLLIALSSHKLSPAECIDPRLSAESKADNLKYFRGSYELTLDPKSEAEFTSPGRDYAEIKVQVHYKGEEGELGVPAKISLVKVNGAWYFANFQFLVTPIWLWCLTIGLILLTMLYSACALRALWKKSKQRGGSLKISDLYRAALPWTWWK